MKKKITILIVCGILTLFCSLSSVYAAIKPIQLKGTVLDESGKPIPGALIKTQNKECESRTDMNGCYSIDIKDGSEYIVVSYIGYNEKKVSVSTAQKEKSIKLDESSSVLDEMVDLGYLTVSRRSLTSAVSAVDGKELKRSPESNLAKTFVGRFAGLTTIETDAELSRGAISSDNAGITLLIRGLSTINGRKPLIVIDGIISPNMNFVYITPDEIESVTVLKDASATAIYGIQGGNGVISIKTKRGTIGKAKVSVTFDESLQQMTKKPQFVSSANYAKMRNEAGYNDGLGSYSQFSQDQIDAFEKGDNSAYPNNDWYKQFIRPVTLMTRAGVNIQGGNAKVRYYSNINYLHQQMPFKTVEEPGAKYNVNPKNDWFNFRSNIDLKINNYLSAFMRLSGNIKLEKTAGYDNETIYKHIFNLPPTMYGPLTPYTDADGNALENGGQVITHDAEDYPVYGMLNRSGYSKALTTNISAQAGITADLSSLIKGLSISGLMAYQTNSINTTNTSQDFERYVRTNDATKLEFTKKGTNNNTPLSYSKSSSSYYNLNLFANANYQRTFGDHSIQAMGYIFYQQRESEDVKGASMLPYKRESMGVSAIYGYKNRYFIKGDIGYSGSEQFHPDHRYIATPAISATWIASDENFMKNISWINLLKLRASYGISANDQLGDSRLLYEDYLSVDGTEGQKGNPNLSAEKMKKQNYGIDINIFKDFTLSFDWYKSVCNNILVSSSELIPEYQGTDLKYYPMLNNGKVNNKGYEISAMYNKQLNKNWSIYFGGSFSYNKNEIVNVGEAQRIGYAYPHQQEGYSIGQKWGYLIDYSNGNGIFNFKDELTNSGLSYSFGTPRVGDFIYKDLNGDKVIDDKDKAPIRNSRYPREYYSFAGGFKYKGWEFNFLFQGVAKATTVINGVGAYEYAYQGVFNDIHRNAWTQERWDRGEAIDYPALSLKNSTSHQPNEFFIMDAAYLRLKNVEIAYTLPMKLSRKIFAQKIRFALSGQNLFTIDNMRSKYIDPEISDLGTFQIYRVFNLGVNLTF